MEFNVTLDNFEKKTQQEQREFVEGVSNAFAGQFVWNGFDSFQSLRYWHVETQMEFRFLFRGTFQMGLSEEEEICARRLCDPPPITMSELRPVHSVEVDAFLAASAPVSVEKAAELLGESLADQIPEYPAFLTMEQGDRILRRIHADSPTEEQWEYFCRAGTCSLFPFGGELPNDAELSRWLDWDISPSNEKVIRNSFGICGLFFGERCKDRYRSSYSDPVGNDESVFAVRGGGAYYWPWQDEEWVWCMSAMRAPSTDLDDDPTSVIRPVFSLFRGKTE